MIPLLSRVSGYDFLLILAAVVGGGLLVSLTVIALGNMKQRPK
jgi:hypothetical protein